MSPSETHHGDQPASSKLMIAALGVVYGDIGTSPLYAFKQSVLMAGETSPQTVIALLSLIIWSLLLVVTLMGVLTAVTLPRLNAAQARTRLEQGAQGCAMHSPRCTAGPPEPVAANW